MNFYRNHLIKILTLLLIILLLFASGCNNDDDSFTSSGQGDDDDDDDDDDGLPSRTAPNAFAIQKLSWSLIGYHLTGEKRYKTEIQKWIADSRRPVLRLLNVSVNLQYGDYFPNNLGHQNMYSLLNLGKIYLGPKDYEFLVAYWMASYYKFISKQE